MLLFLLLSASVRVAAQTSNEFAMRQTGYYMGSSSYKVTNTGDRGKFPVRYLSFEGMTFTGDYYYIGNANYLVNGNNAWKAGDDGIRGVDISLLEFSCGRQYGQVGLGITGNLGWHGPHLPNNVTGAFEDNGHFFGVGGQLAHVKPIGSVYRTVSTLTTEALFTNSGKKVVDGFSVRFDSQLQFVPFRWLALGVRPTVEFRKFKLDNNEKTDLRSFTSTVQFCVGINLWKNAQSY